jgi:hypothetical protein
LYSAQHEEERVKIMFIYVDEKDMDWLDWEKKGCDDENK